MPKKIDLTGQRFNKLLVIEEAPKKGNRIAWRCKCDCGNITDVVGTDLRNNHTKSCGKCNSTKIDMLGKKINRLTVIGEAPNAPDGSAMWLCKCDCGKEIIVKGNTLRRNGIKSCGCERIEKFIENNKKRALNLVGKRFGNLTVIEKTNKRLYNAVLWKCKCDCGNIVYIDTGNLTSGNTKSCGCGRHLSFGEEKIKKILSDNNILFEQEKTFEDCRYKTTNFCARFDFYLPNYNCLIEYDGSQHSVVGKGIYDNPEKLKITQERDKFKNDYALKNGFTLIRIPYLHLNNICLEDLLPKTSQFII